ncbi:MAG: hypothetical protein CME70_08950 [Halobacteriovorax sp.]|nr:hypothetical protein [Halobacteriovorax sp.]|tara:strand:+ start:53156 stop:53884 length:729 start_codon:yes stop_codon:yes gene_type:complete
MTRNTSLQGHSRVSVTVPCLNESKNVGRTIETLQEVLNEMLDYEVIVINDGSNDDTQKLVEELQAKNAKITLINHSTTKGRGYSIREGYSVSKFEYLICFNGKYDIPADQMKLIFEPIGKEDLIISYQANTYERPFIRRLFSKLYTLILNLSFGLSLKYFNGSSLIKKEHFQRLELHSDSYALDAEILIKLIKSGISYQEVPVNDIIEDERNTRSNSLPNILGVFQFYIKTFLEINILRRKY